MYVTVILRVINPIELEFYYNYFSKRYLVEEYVILYSRIYCNMLYKSSGENRVMRVEDNDVSHLILKASSGILSI